MAGGYTWRRARASETDRLPGPDRLGWWIVVAVLLAVVLHVVAFLILARIQIWLPFLEAGELRTQPVQLEQVTIPMANYDEIPAAPEEVPPVDTASMLEELDVLDKLPEDHELDLTPEVVDPEFALDTTEPALAAGEPDLPDMEAVQNLDLTEDLAQLGTTPDPLPKAVEGQVVVDPGAALEDPELDKFTEQILRRGSKEGVGAGTLDGVVSLDDIVGLPEDVLVGKRTMLPSDLLFAYDSAELRESARVGLMKLGLLIERNPRLFCWIEGYTDLYGADSYNLDLSRRRAAAVKSYLVGSLRLPGDKIVTLGFGKARPLVSSGSIEEQAINRRVEIKMRREPPSAADRQVDPVATVPPSAAPQPRTQAPKPPRAEVVKPEDLPAAGQKREEPRSTPPRAQPVAPEDTVKPAAPRAMPVEEAVEDAPPPPRAQPVEEE